jgi:hypothetical protein
MVAPMRGHKYFDEILMVLKPQPFTIEPGWRND